MSDVTLIIFQAFVETNHWHDDLQDQDQVVREQLLLFSQEPLPSLSPGTFYTQEAPCMSSAVVAERRKLREGEDWEEPKFPQVPATLPSSQKTRKRPASPRGLRR